MNLSDLRPGESAIIDSIAGNIKLSKRLLALGCIEGTTVKLTNIAPLGDPILINIRGFNLAIRKRDAKNISVKEA